MVKIIFICVSHGMLYTFVEGVLPATEAPVMLASNGHTRECYAKKNVREKTDTAR